MELTLDAFTVLVVVSAVIPIFTGLLTKASASVAVKQLVTLALSAANGLVVTATQIDGTAVISKESFLNTVLAFVIAGATYLQVYKPHDANASLAADSGIG